MRHRTLRHTQITPTGTVLINQHASDSPTPGCPLRFANLALLPSWPARTRTTSTITTTLIKMTATLVYQVPAGDFGAYLLGPWKRTLECREFGKTYEHQRTSSSVVVIEHALGVAAEPPTYVSIACMCVLHRRVCTCGEAGTPFASRGGRVRVENGGGVCDERGLMVTNAICLYPSSCVCIRFPHGYGAMYKGQIGR